MDTKDYIIVGLSVALTLTLVAVIIVLVRRKAQMEEPRFYKDDYGPCNRRDREK